MRSRPNKTRTISISLPQRLLEDVEQCAETDGFRGRSEVVRAGIDLLLQKRNKENDHTGQSSGTLTVLFDESATGEIAAARHDHQDIVTSLLHSHTTNGRCIEAILLEGEASQLTALANSLRGHPLVDLVELVLVPNKEKTQQATPANQG